MTIASARTRTIELLLLAAIAMAPVMAMAQMASLKVQVSGANPPAGSVEVTLFDSEESFLATPFLQESGEVAEDGTFTAEFFGVAEGRYAIVVVHDENDNGRLDTGFLGFFGESIGYSNDAKPFLGRPSFDAAAIDVSGEEVVEEISLD